MDDTKREHARESGADEEQRASELKEYLKAQKEEEAWLERMQKAAKARKAEEEGADTTKK